MCIQLEAGVGAHVFRTKAGLFHCPAGDDFNPSNYINMAAVLFMWVVMPAFGAAAYVPSITLGELGFGAFMFNGMETGCMFDPAAACRNVAIWRGGVWRLSTL